MKNTSLLSNLSSLFLEPNTGCNTQPVPLPPVRDILVTASISKVCGSTKTSLTVPCIIGSAAAPTPPLLVSIPMIGGFNISYPEPLLVKSIDSNDPKNIWLSDFGDLIWTPFINTPISVVGSSCLDATNKFWDRGIFLKILFASSSLLECLFNTNLWTSVVDVVGPTCTVLAVPICAVELYNLNCEMFWFGPGKIGSTK